MTLFFTIARVLRTGYKAIRAAAGILIVAHATYKWVQRRFEKPRTSRVAAAA